MQDPLPRLWGTDISCAPQQGYGLCPSIPLPFTPSSLTIIPLSINAVKGKVKCLSAADLESVRKGSGHLKRKKAAISLRCKVKGQVLPAPCLCQKIFKID